MYICMRMHTWFKFMYVYLCMHIIRCFSLRAFEIVCVQCMYVRGYLQIQASMRVFLNIFQNTTIGCARESVECEGSNKGLMVRSSWKCKLKLVYVLLPPKSPCHLYRCYFPGAGASRCISCTCNTSTTAIARCIAVLLLLFVLSLAAE